MSNNDLIRRGDVLAAAKGFIGAETAITALPAADPLADPRVQALVEALRELVQLNDDYSPFGGEMFQDRVNRTWDRARAIIAAFKGGEA
jgi:hypothetical protein